MWREYTKETPARPWWGLICSALALAGTTALAQYVTKSKGGTVVSPSALISVGGWPVAFRLPEGFHRVSAADPWNDPVNAEGTSGEMAFRRTDRRRGSADLTIRFEWDEGPISPAEAFHTVTGLSGDDAEAIELGPLSGLWGFGDSSDGKLVWAAVGTSPDGLAVQIELKTGIPGSKQRKEFEQICSSMQYKIWAMHAPN
jgi:hypothetical protein